MGILRTGMFLLILTGAVSASLPRLAVVSIDLDEFSPDDLIIASVMTELEKSGRFQIVELGEDAYLNPSADSLMYSLKTLAADRGIDVFLAMEILHPEETDQTIFRNDSLITYRTVTVDVLGRFYSSTGTLIGTIRNSVTREEMLPYSPDLHRLASLSAQQLASRSVLELFPLEASFTASDSKVFSVPLGTDQGIENGTVMAVVASSFSGIPDDITGYEELRSRGLLQIIEAGTTQSTARLLSGRLIEGGTVTAVEQSAPAIMFLEYGGSMMSVEPGEGIQKDDLNWNSNLRLGVETGKWGMSLGGAITAGGLEHSSMIGVNLQAGTRIPLSSPSLGLRLTAGGEIAFYMQDVRSTLLSSNATAISVSAVADAALEYLFSGHLGVQLGVTGYFGSTADSWTVQEYSGNVRDAEPEELYYTELKPGPAGIHAGLIYFIF